MTNSHELKNGLLFLLAESAGGIYNGEQLRKICEVAQDDSVILKVTEDQRLGFMLEPSRVESVKALLEPCGVSLRFYRSPAAPAPKSCLGELCPFAVQDALGDSIELGVLLAERFKEANSYLKIGINGCEKACVGSAVDDIHIVGEDSGYKIAIGGKCAEIPQLGQFLIDNVTKENLADVVCRVLETYYAKRENEETLLDVAEREGMSLFTAAAEGQQALPVIEDTPVGLDDSALTSSEESEADNGVEEFDLNDTVTPAESKTLLAEEDFDVSMDADMGDAVLDDKVSDAMDVPVDVDTELDADFGSRVKEQLEVAEEINIDDNIDVASAAQENLEAVREVDVDSELSGVAEVQAIASEMSADEVLSDDLELIEDLDAEVGNNIVDVDEHIVVSEGIEDVAEPISAESHETALSENEPISDDLSLEEPGMTFEEAGADDVGRMTAALHSEASAASDHGAGQSSGSNLLSVVPDAISVPDDEVSVESASEFSSSDDFMEEESVAISSTIDDIEAEELQKAEAAMSEPALREEVEDAVPTAIPVPAKPAPAAAVAAKSKGRLRLKLGEQDVKIVLPNGIECAVPLAWVEENGVFEMDVGESTLSVQKQGDFLVFRYGDLVMNVPSLTLTAAA